ncbi:DUF6249 domain-containing protein [Dysgonomonas massiliensis]|uniref:DUF6249 domain-containing protein n=1 Tax=Dysgonomonas massiliensis TaxID=2040292 RepID=UPI000C75FF82|nr:DUF6249 domain-containing protein [Dysgonomonas massiliensis]
MKDFLAGMVPIIGAIMIFGIPMLAIYLGIYNTKMKNRENMELIKQGIIPPQKEHVKPTPNKYRSLRNGFLCIGIGLGIIVGLIIYNNSSLDLGKGEYMFVMGASILFFLGIAYVAFFMVVKDKNLDNGSDNE